MSKTILHFAHANSYPAEVYRVFFQYLRQHYDVHALSMHAHNPAFPIRSGWHALTAELLSEIESRHRQPVVLVGHSMGGMLCLMAAKAKPELVRAVVLLDSPVVAGWRATLLSAAKLARIDKHFSPARLSEKRRDRWPSREEAWRHFADKPMFAKWPEEVLRDYIEHGMVEHPEGGLTLRFSREVETRIYRSLPHHLGALVRRNFPRPVGFIGGLESEENRMAGLIATRRLAGRNFRLLPGGHLFPMESPQLAAEATHHMIQQLLVQASGGRA